MMAATAAGDGSATAAGSPVEQADRFVARHAAATPGGADAVAGFRASLARAAQCVPEQATELARHASRLDSRAGMGRVRLVDGALASDLLYDLAQPLAAMALEQRLADANALANRYVDIAPQGATGWSLLPLFMSLRAGIAGDASAARALIAPVPPRLIAIGGLSGTGKTTLSRLLAPLVGRAPGARILRSDVFRKRLAGFHPEQRLPPSHYTSRSDAETYEALFESADDHLACGTSVILDAVFMSRSERDVAEMLAMRWRVPFIGFWLEAPERDRVARVEGRVGDASDATAEVAREQSRRSVGELGYWHRIRVNRPLDLIVQAARGALDRAR